MSINWLTSRLRRRTAPAKRHAPPPLAARLPMLEPLEGRKLLSGTAAVISTVADNRGLVQIRFNKALTNSTVTKKNIKVYTTGADGKFNTADDVAVSETVSYSASKKQITINSAVAADTQYRVKIFASKVKDIDGLKIDGEFKSGGKSGNGKQGGDFDFRVKRDTSANPVARFLTNSGTINVKLFRGATATNTATPIAVAHFLDWVNHADYDNLFATRLVQNFVLQMGAMKLNSNGLIDLTRNVPSGTYPYAGEPGNSNVAGTIAYALNGDIGGPTPVNSADTASNEFFFNIVSNTNLDTYNAGFHSGPFTVFGKIADSKSFAVLTAINQLHSLNLTGSSLDTGTVDLNNIPVQATVPVTGETPGGGPGGVTNKQVETFKDLLVVSRVSVLSKVSAV